LPVTARTRADALVMSALDLVVVHRVDRDLPYIEPSRYRAAALADPQSARI
jgi:hypothetical protein